MYSNADLYNRQGRILLVLFFTAKEDTFNIILTQLYIIFCITIYEDLPITQLLWTWHFIPIHTQVLIETPILLVQIVCGPAS